MNNLPGVNRENEQQEIRDALESAYQISNYLKCGVDKTALAIMISLVENGCKPEHVAMIVSEIKRAPQ
jgi:hypothetical protein